MSLIYAKCNETKNAISLFSVFSLFQFQNNFWKKIYEKKLSFFNFF